MLFVNEFDLISEKSHMTKMQVFALKGYDKLLRPASLGQFD